MITMGDEVRRTQHGNNNAYCHDDALSWFDWSLLQKHPDVHRFARLLIRQRARRTAEHERQRVTLTELIARATKAWHGVTLDRPDWSDWSHTIALTVALREFGYLVHIIFSAYTQPLDFEIPHSSAVWRRWIDTALESPADISPLEQAPPVTGNTYHVAPRSVVVLFSEPERTDS
jgi:glycogen operon protein